MSSVFKGVRVKHFVPFQHQKMLCINIFEWISSGKLATRNTCHAISRTIQNNCSGLLCAVYINIQYTCVNVRDYTGRANNSNEFDNNVI